MNNAVKKLIIRKLRHKKREQERLWLSVTRKAYTKMNENILANISCGKVGRAFISVPLDAYREITGSAITVTKEWPGIVWEIIASLLDKAHVVPSDSQEVHAIIDEFAWAAGQNPFTIDYIDPERLSEIVNREARRYGVDISDIKDSFNRQLTLAATTAKCEMLNTARQAREGIGIAIEEFLLAQSHGEQATKATTNKGTEQPDNKVQTNGLEIGSPEWRRQTARKAADVRHDLPGGSRDKHQQIRDIWATGKYSSRDICAEEECAALDMSFSTARKALRNTPKPT